MRCADSVQPGSSGRAGDHHVCAPRRGARQRPTATFLPSQRICERCYCSGRQQNQAILRRHRLKERQYAQSYTRFLVCGVVCLGSAGRHNLHADSAPRPTESYAHEASNSSTTKPRRTRSEEHTSELQSHSDLVCRLLLEKKKEK